MNVYIRPLCEADAAVSCRWRNDPEVWQYTGSRPDRHIDEAIEIQWLRRVTADSTSARFAVCVEGTDEYIGNVQLTDIRNSTAQFHIFVGNRNFWGKGVSTKATALILTYAWQMLSLDSVYLEVNVNNTAAVRSYEKNGFRTVAIQGQILRQEVFRPIASAGPVG